MSLGYVRVGKVKEIKLESASLELGLGLNLDLNQYENDQKPN